MPELPQTHLAEAVRFWQRAAAPQTAPVPESPPGYDQAPFRVADDEQSDDWTDGRDEE